MTAGDLTWFKSRYSGSEGDNCVEVATCPERVHVRDSKDIAGPRFAVPAAAWSAFVTHAANADR
jgi:hypothetical protein